VKLNLTLVELVTIQVAAKFDGAAGTLSTATVTDGVYADGTNPFTALTR
jgi:hypothetical protein